MSTITPPPVSSPRVARVTARERRRHLIATAQVAGALVVIAAGVYVAAGVTADIIEERQIGPAISFEPCATEDDPGPCYWDASTRSNGTGRSFIVIDDVIYPVPVEAR